MEARAELTNNIVCRERWRRLFAAVELVLRNNTLAE
jgi:hypothetical protein